MKVMQKLNRKITDMSDHLIQNETSATALFQIASSEPVMMRDEVNSVIKVIAKEKIQVNSMSKTESNTQTENHNANAAKADING